MRIRKVASLLAAAALAMVLATPTAGARPAEQTTAGCGSGATVRLVDAEAWLAKCTANRSLAADDLVFRVYMINDYNGKCVDANFTDPYQVYLWSCYYNPVGSKNQVWRWVLPGGGQPFRFESEYDGKVLAAWSGNPGDRQSVIRVPYSGDASEYWHFPSAGGIGNFGWGRVLEGAPEFAGQDPQRLQMFSYNGASWQGWTLQMT